MLELTKHEQLGYHTYACTIHGRFWSDEPLPVCPWCEARISPEANDLRRRADIANMRIQSARETETK